MGAMHTRLTEMLGIEHPVMLAGMGGVSYHAVVAAVSGAGGFGTLGAATMSSEQLDSEMAAVRAATDKPFGVDLLAALPERMVGDAHKVVSGGASLFVAGLGVPRDVIKILHDGNVLVASMCGKVRHAIAAVEAGCDFVIAQGTEAGGHTGTVATMPLVPQIVDEVGARVPVVAAGGIFDGRGLAAAIALGADGVWLGTRFIATPEARAVRGYKDALLRTEEDGTVISRGFTGKTLRAVRNEYTQYIEQHPEELTKFPEQMMHAMEIGVLHLGGDESSNVDPDKECYPAGQGVGAMHTLIPAGDLVRQIVDEAEHALARGSQDRRCLAPYESRRARDRRVRAGRLHVVQRVRHSLLRRRRRRRRRFAHRPLPRAAPSQRDVRADAHQVVAIDRSAHHHGSRSRHRDRPGRAVRPAGDVRDRRHARAPLVAGDRRGGHPRGADPLPTASGSARRANASGPACAGDRSAAVTWASRWPRRCTAAGCT